MAKVPFQPIPELSVGGAAGTLACAGTALVGINDSSSGGFTSAATGGADVDVVIGGEVMALVVVRDTTVLIWVNGTTAGGFTLRTTAGAGAYVVAIGGGTATALVLVSSAKAVGIPAAKTTAQM